MDYYRYTDTRAIDGNIDYHRYTDIRATNSINAIGEPREGNIPNKLPI